jgi:hypothetical protein
LAPPFTKKGGKKKTMKSFVLADRHPSLKRRGVNRRLTSFPAGATLKSDNFTNHKYSKGGNMSNLFDVATFLVGLAMIAIAGLLVKQAIFTMRDEKKKLILYSADSRKRIIQTAYWKIFAAVQLGLIGTSVLTLAYCLFLRP